MALDLFPILNKSFGHEWFISGSLGYGMNTPGSDLDVCIPIWHDDSEGFFWKNVNNISNKQVEVSSYWGGKKITLFEKPSEVPTACSSVLNIVPLHPQSFLSWAITTHQMRKWAEGYKSLTRTIPDKALRVHVFESLESANRFSIPFVENPSRYLLDHYEIWKELQSVCTAEDWYMEVPF